MERGKYARTRRGQAAAKLRQIEQKAAKEAKMNRVVAVLLLSFVVLVGRVDAVELPGARLTRNSAGEVVGVDGITLTMDEYREVRSQPELFAIAVGHEMPDVEDVVGANDRFNVVRKREGGPAELARDLA